VSYEQPRFRITPWPGIRLPHPPVLGGIPYQVADGVLTPDEARWASNARVVNSLREYAADEDPLSQIGEIYLELVRVDLDDEPSIVSFCERFRTLGVRDRRFAAFSAFPQFDRVKRRLENVWRPAGSESGLLNLAEGIEDFRFGARCVRDLVRAQEILSGNDDGSAWESLPEGASWISDSDRAIYEEHDTLPSRPDEAASAITRLVNPGLGPLQPHLIDGPLDHLESEWAILSLPLYSVCSLEVYNHVAERATFTRCANEGCGTRFVRQHGRAVKGQHRSHGVMYCSFSCAHTQNYRRKVRRTRSQLST
jgi:hypothetical protein